MAELSEDEGWTDIGTTTDVPDFAADPEPPERWPDWWHVVRCLDCDGRELPFISEEARSAWMREHREGTGHDRWLLVSARRDAP